MQTAVRDKFSALWLSYSSISDYLKCPRVYFLKNIYRNPKTRKKIQLMSPALALGQTVHAVLEEISVLPVDKRLEEPLQERFSRLWQKMSGERGGFTDTNTESGFRRRGEGMIERLQKNPGPLLRQAIRPREKLPHFWLNNEDNIILCGRIDWLEYFPGTDSVGILDFKTGKFDEDPDSLQLPVYILLAGRMQKRAVSRVSYWYLDRDDAPVEVKLPDTEKSMQVITEIAKKIELAKKLEHFNCKQKSGCLSCLAYTDILEGRAKYIGVNDYGQEIYIQP